jgi:hypothetical protein
LGSCSFFKYSNESRCGGFVREISKRLIGIRKIAQRQKIHQDRLLSASLPGGLCAFCASTEDCAYCRLCSLCYLGKSPHVDERKYVIIENIDGYLWSDLVLYTLILTVLGFLLVQFLRFSEKT